MLLLLEGQTGEMLDLVPNISDLSEMFWNGGGVLLLYELLSLSLQLFVDVSLFVAYFQFAVYVCLLKLFSPTELSVLEVLQ